MKFVIIGLHSSGKHELVHQLEELGMKYGKCFSSVPNIDNIEKLYAKGEFEQYSVMDINEVFENNAYIFIQEQPDNILNVSANKFFEGLSKYTYDTNDVFVLSPDQFMSIAVSNIPNDTVYVWLDNTKSNRYNRYKLEKREYNFNERDNIERKDMKDFVKTIYNVAHEKILYFTNEDPGRIAAIVYAIYKNPELLNIFIKNYN